MRPPSRILTAVPQTLHVHLEIAKAIRKLAEQDEQEQLQKRSAPAAIRCDREDIAAALREACRECASILRLELRKAGYDPDEPRVPAGNPDGGQWTSTGGQDSSGDSRTASDATPDNTWKPGAQYAANDAANENLTPEQVCQQAYSDGMANIRTNPSLSPTDYLNARYQLTSALDLCLNLSNGVRPIARDGDFVWFFGAGVVIFRSGRLPQYVRSLNGQ